MVKKPNILCLDDEPEFLVAYRIAIEDDLKFKAFLCQDLKQAKKIHEENAIDVIITDVYIPGYSRNEVINFIEHCLEKGIRVIVVAGLYEKDVGKIKGIKYIIKDLGVIEELKKVIRNSVFEKRMSRALSQEERQRLLTAKHVETPTAKWIKEQLAEKGVSREKKLAMLEVYYQALEKELQEAARHGEWRKSELEDLTMRLDRVAKQIRVLKRGKPLKPLPQKKKKKRQKKKKKS